MTVYPAGALILGVGIGSGKNEWGDLGEQPDLKKRGAMLDEGLSVLVGLWSGKPFNYDGDYYHVRNACFLPKPLQSARVFGFGLGESGQIETLSNEL